ncbi:DUF2637 domain-containing protein [Streptomyces sp. 3MP-14]|uniref:DUF2637 domain-containing protein n=1 Tax=Streptomyces mimosae TaxID=2586635 RepID=A0A5N6A0U3_9ACTN|nr:MULTISPECIES: DUF2637 domain-containing protein [Streptomyces]KAB8161822.1 DUF2637 domain-containing protein [Streptomyces mimosae]KAB8174910.1 DUF2637 domain-containing protein [Streptomyces sp. 3MP-14]
MRAQLIRPDPVLVQAVIAAALSFAHIHDLAAAAGQDGWKAWAYPVSVDLLLVAAWRRLRSGNGVAAGWCWFLIALTASLGANIATAGLLDLGDVPDWLRVLVAGWPALAFLGGTLLAHTPTEEHQRLAPTEPETAPAAPPPAVPAALVQHARKIAAEHQQRTGQPIDTPTLRARLGVPAPLAEAITHHL